MVPNEYGFAAQSSIVLVLTGFEAFLDACYGSGNVWVSIFLVLKSDNNHDPFVSKNKHL